MVNDDLAARRAANGTRSGAETEGDGWPLLPHEQMEADGTHIRPEVRAAMAKLSLLDQVLKCAAEGGAQLPAHLVPGAVQAIVVGLATLERRDGGAGRSARELRLWVADLQRSHEGHGVVTVERETPDERIGSREAARIIGCSRRHVTVLVRRRWLDATMVGRTLVLRRRQVVEYAEERGPDGRSHREEP